MRNKMYVIGITGGVGAGKSEVLNNIESHCSCKILKADELAHVVREKGGCCYEPLIDLLGEDIVLPDGTIDRTAMAGKIFSDESLLKQVNDLIHPAVRETILSVIEEEHLKGELDAVFIEAALLIEEGYEEICDELWYIYADEEVRSERLRRSRGYTPERIRGIMDQQLSEAEFRSHCKVIIDNSGDFLDTEVSLKEALEEKGIYR